MGSFVIGSLTIAAAGWQFVSIGRYDLVALLLAWQYGLLMQIPEWMQWKSMRTGTKTAVAAPLAFWLNVLQPLAIVVSVWYASGRPPAVAIGALVVYAALFVLDRESVAQAVRRGIAPRGSCRHLNLDDWWSTPRVVLFHVVFVMAYLQLPPKLAWLNILIFEGTFLYATTFVKCGSASVWCWSVFVAGMALWLAWRAGQI